MKLRKLHKIMGVTLSPFLLLVSATGMALLLRKDNLYSPQTKRLLVGVHTWESAAKYSGGILAVGLVTMVATGLVMTIDLQRKKMQRERSKRQAVNISNQPTN